MEAEHGLLANPEFWVAVAFFIFVGIVLYMKVPAQIAKSLDARSDKIRKDLDEARRLREEAQALLAKYQRKQNKAEKEAADIIQQAKGEAKALAREAREAAEAHIERRTKAAEDKIARAEAQAVADVERAAAEIAVAAAEKILTEQLSPEKAQALIDDSIRELGKRLN